MRNRCCVIFVHSFALNVKFTYPQKISKFSDVSMGWKYNIRMRWAKVVALDHCLKFMKSIHGKLYLVKTWCVFGHSSVISFWAIISQVSGGIVSKRISRSSCSKIIFTIGILKNFPNFTGKHLRWPKGLQRY